MNSSFSHVALLVPNAEASAEFLEAHDIDTEEPETFDSEGTKEVYVGTYEEQRGLLLLLEAISEGPYKAALEKRGPSLHHIAMDVTDIQQFALQAQGSGWKLHPISEETMEHKTAWFFSKGVPTLIEAHQKKQPSTNPPKVSKIELPIRKDQLALFEGIGLGNVVFPNGEVTLTIDGQKFSFSQIACLN